MNICVFITINVYIYIQTHSLQGISSHDYRDAEVSVFAGW